MKRLDPIFSSVVGLTVFQFIYTWTGTGNTYLHWVVYSQEPRPFVYRALIPLLSRALAFLTGFSAETCAVFLAVVAGMGLYFALKYLYILLGMDEKLASIPAFVACEVFCLTLVVSPHVYDVPTALFFTLALIFIARGDDISYLILFPIMTLNRETSFLISLFWVVSSFNKTNGIRFISMSVYQAFVYFVIRYVLALSFASMPGLPAYWYLHDNLVDYFGSLRSILITLSIMTVLMIGVFRGWSSKPMILRTAFLVIFPLQVLLHLTFGVAWEVRTFAESMPILSVLVLWGIEARPRVPMILKTSRQV